MFKLLFNFVLNVCTAQVLYSKRITMSKSIKKVCHAILKLKRANDSVFLHNFRLRLMSLNLTSDWTRSSRAFLKYTLYIRIANT